MENYSIQINEIDIGEDHPHEIFEIIFWSDKNIKLSKFEMDINEISNQSAMFGDFIKLTFDDKIKIFKNFVQNLRENKTGALNFYMENGVRSIRFREKIMEFRFEFITMSLELDVKICDCLVNEFEKIAKLFDN